MGSKLEKFRECIEEAGFDGFIIPREDRFQAEYVAPSDERLAWLTGFTGSAGQAIILKDKAAFFTDGRYTLQAKNQIQEAAYVQLNMPEDKPAEWVKQNANSNQTLGFDPWLLTVTQLEAWSKKLERSELELKPATRNPVDALWHDKPDTEIKTAFVHPMKYAGKTHLDKLSRLAKTLENSNCDAVLLSCPESIAWLLNIRGQDVEHVPVLHSFAVVNSRGEVDLFVDPGKIVDEVAKHLGSAVRIHEELEIVSFMQSFEGSIAIDPKQCPVAIFQEINPSCTVIKQQNPCLLPKAKKNWVEIEGSKEAHIYDGVALTKLLVWLSAQLKAKNQVSELDVSAKILELRQQQPNFKSASFATIAASGPNGAIIHYLPNDETNREINAKDLFLLDSGGQYLDGTTDVTRTVAYDPPSTSQRDHYTRVLKGHIAIATARFPSSTSGGQLDGLARQYLWEAGLDYAHGTGHGVGSYLSVHEGPQSLGKNSSVSLEPGMILSNEPGFYQPGSYGIRLENLVYVTESAFRGADGKAFLEFETLTMVPFDLKLVDVQMLSSHERNWLNAYHAKVRRVLLEHLDYTEQQWLIDSTPEI